MSSNYPPGVSESTKGAPWNQERSQEDIEEEISALERLGDKISDLQIELELLHFNDLDDLFTTDSLAEYETGLPGDMLDAMQVIIEERIKGLKENA